ncbi:hypothetical protein BDV34DRAFT_214141 [Aspergillus parasiticus]|uniref:DUF3500 domain protein n=1 Tax=Aspergillus parasiticus TaxID=5067 RepID=A0A5N6DHP7_ASPPA|nr:hypothetical protein BDV34DRAFT_214141 [Aspergillus parasiticus]
MAANFRDYVPPPDHPKIKDLHKFDARTYSENAVNAPGPQRIVSKWVSKLDEPFFGITVDGTRKEGLFHLEDEGAPVEQMVDRANRILQFDPLELQKFSHEIDSDNWRKWSNPEFIIYRTGVRLEDLNEEQRQAILDLLQASLSPVGYSRVVGAMQTNDFLGELCNAKSILNRYSYQFTLYGKPSTTEPWGFSLFGHHLSLNIVTVGKQMTVSPIFLGAEPNIIDSGPDNGVRILDSAGSLPLTLMQSLPKNLQDRAQVYKTLHDEQMPDDRWNPADQVGLLTYEQRHLGGAFQDNRVIPNEGIQVEQMPQPQQKDLLHLISFYLDILPSGPYNARVNQVKRHWNETYFCWIGGYGDEDAFYYRIQSPVLMIEFDHHSGVFLLNKEPAKYHIHTIVRTPNGNDYGREWIRLHRRRFY